MRMMEGDGTVDVVIPVLNGFPEIKECIDGLLAQSVPVRSILVLDSGSTDGTLDYLRGIDRVRVIPVEPATFNHGLTRNLGWQHSDASFLLYTVQDAKPVGADFVAELMIPLADASIAGVCGQQIVCRDPRNNPVEWFRPISAPQTIRWQVKDAADFDASDPELKRRMCGWDNVVAMYRRSSLERIPFRDTVFGEDMAWAVDALRSGAAIVYQPSARACHHHLEDPAFTLRRALSSMFLRYRLTGYLHPLPDRSWRPLLRIVKACLTGNSLPLKRRFGWLRYNILRRQALRQAHERFADALQRGESELEVLYKEHVQTPHRPLKHV